MTKFICVTGAAGFIGRHVVRTLLARGDYVYAVDRLDYAADFDTLPATPHLMVRTQDIRTLGRLPDVDTIIHLAASTHVDNSITEAEDFVANNVGSTAKMLELARAKSQHGVPHFVHISTDEVYGPALVGDTVGFTEDDAMYPSSPYAASKAGADLLAQAWAKTYGMPVTVMRPTNTYGTGQYPEKLIPKAIRCLQLGRPIPIHGDGSQTRSWLAVDDLVSAVLHVVDKRLLGVYNVGGNTEASVWKVAQTIRNEFLGNAWLDGVLAQGFTRPACDQRYLVNDTALRATGWTPTGNFWRDLPQLVTQERGRWRW